MRVLAGMALPLTLSHPSQPMPELIATFANPSTGTAYRLVLAGSTWRITKSLESEGRTRLAHLRGPSGAGEADIVTVAALVAGTSGTTPRADPHRTFTAVVLCDLERTADLLTAVARQASEVYEVGCKGFRPHSPVLRQQRERAMATTAGEMVCMAQAWHASGLVASRDLPRWLVAALADVKATYPDGSQRGTGQCTV